MGRDYSAYNVKPYNRGGHIVSDIRKLNFSVDEVEKITGAWSEGKSVVLGYSVRVGRKGLALRIEVFNVDNCCCIHPGAIDITKDWLKIRSMLDQNQIPKDWMELIIKKLQKEVIRNDWTSNGPRKSK